MNSAELFSQPWTWADMDRWHDEVRELRQGRPAVMVDQDGYEPYLVLLRHEDVYAVSRDNARWLNTQRSVLGPELDWQQMMASGMPAPATLVHLDGEAHRLHRDVTRDWFKPAAVGQRQARIDELAGLFIDRMRDLGGRCDFAHDIAKPYTLRVIMDIYGVPEKDEPLMMELTQGIFGAADPEYIGDTAEARDKVMASVFQSIQYFNELTADRRASPRDDLASTIANGMIDGAPMGDMERLWYYIIVATAGHDTTSFALAGGLEALLRDERQLDLLRRDKDLVVNTAEECIRWTSPVRHFMRYAAEDSEVAGHSVPAGGRILLSYPSANRDEDVFADSMSFDVGRPDADKLISFGVGGHFCLGAQFARRELRTFLSHLMDAVDEIEPDGPAEWSQSHFVSGVKHLPIRYRMR